MLRDAVIAAMPAATMDSQAQSLNEMREALALNLMRDGELEEAQQVLAGNRDDMVLDDCDD